MKQIKTASNKVDSNIGSTELSNVKISNNELSQVNNSLKNDCLNPLESTIEIQQDLGQEAPIPASIVCSDNLLSENSSYAEETNKFPHTQFKDGSKIFNADCMDVLRTMEDNSVSSIVTDPPYGLTTTKNGKKSNGGVLNQPWDATGVELNVDLWRECLRVLKPGGYMIAFSSGRTYHKIATAIEEAGFVIHDQIMWLYGTGYPKSQSIDKQIDKNSGDYELSKKLAADLKTARKKRKMSKSEADKIICGGTTLYSFFEGRKNGKFIYPSMEHMINIVKCFPELNEYKIQQEQSEREVIGQHQNDMGGFVGERIGEKGGNITAPKTEAAKKWNGYGTGLKGSHEPIVLARKPISENSHGLNVLKHGVGALNIDVSRIPYEDTEDPATNPKYRHENNYKIPSKGKKSNGTVKHSSSKNDINTSGRYPANVILDKSCVDILNDQCVKLFCNKITSNITKASNFFYSPKASQTDRNEGLSSNNKNIHITVKPYGLMQYLVQLITPDIEGSVCLDLFGGSGSTGKAIAQLSSNIKFILIEKEEKYYKIAAERIANEFSKNESQNNNF